MPTPVRSSLTALACLFLAVGCRPAEVANPPDPAAFPDAVQKLTDLSGEVLRAFQDGRPSDADAPLHQVGQAVGDLKRLAPVARLTAQQQTAVDEAVERVLDAFAELHGPMHEPEFPEDFDFEPIGVELRGGLDQLMAVLPEEIASRVTPLARPDGSAGAEEPVTPSGAPAEESTLDAE